MILMSEFDALKHTTKHNTLLLLRRYIKQIYSGNKIQLKKIIIVLQQLLLY